MINEFAMNITRIRRIPILLCIVEAKRLKNNNRLKGQFLIGGEDGDVNVVVTNDLKKLSKDVVGDVAKIIDNAFSFIFILVVNLESLGNKNLALIKRIVDKWFKIALNRNVGNRPKIILHSSSLANGKEPDIDLVDKLAELFQEPLESNFAQISQSLQQLSDKLLRAIIP